MVCDGVLTCHQVLDTVKALEHEGDRVTRFSATGFSLGGLIARYCITYAPNISLVYTTNGYNHLRCSVCSTSKDSSRPSRLSTLLP